MAIDIKLEAKNINSIQITGGGYSARLEIDLDSVELTDAVDAKTIVDEYSNDDLLEAIGESNVIEWLEEQGFTVTSGDES